MASLKGLFPSNWEGSLEVINRYGDRRNFEGATAITVFQQPGTELRGMTTITNGIMVHARGLLFLDAGAYKLVASRVMAP